MDWTVVKITVLSINHGRIIKGSLNYTSKDISKGGVFWNTLFNLLFLLYWEGLRPVLDVFSCHMIKEALLTLIVTKKEK